MGFPASLRIAIAKLVQNRDRSTPLERLLYMAVSAVVIWWVACRFYSSLRLQTLYSLLWSEPGRLEAIIRRRQLGEWSAPLDDVFIHFDFARSAARGHPFQWSEGNGYSSGGTSLLYPFVLAGGYLAGFDGLRLMEWAAVAACTCVFGLLLAARCLFRELPRYTSYLGPPVLLCVGALDWTLFSGMEVALLLAIWGATLLAWDDYCLQRRASQPAPKQALSLAWIGALSALLVAVRPEAVVCAAVFTLACAAELWRTGHRRRVPLALLVMLPTALLVSAQAVANRMLTGESTAAGALVKLELFQPYFSAQQVFDAWKFHVVYQVLRVTNYHLSDVPGVGWILWVVAAVPFFFSATRRYALVLWASAVLWVLMVALNGQVRWQNERYTMPALAWLLLSASLGAALLLEQSRRVERKKWQRILPVVALLTAAAFFVQHEAPRFKDQVWFFGRASRNILDQHLRTGRLIAGLQPQPHRVLVGDAGAITYAADVPALDIIGLGGFRGLPFARASRLGVAASIELIERIPAHDRPDLFAIYPGWWENLPLWFGERIGEVPVRGNVICAGPSKVLYQADWSSLQGSGRPSELTPNERVADELDILDLVSEREHRYRSSPVRELPAVMKRLPDRARRNAAFWDGGRSLARGASASFVMCGLAPPGPVRLVIRSAGVEPAAVRLWVLQRAVGQATLLGGDQWSETRLALPPTLLDVDCQTLKLEAVGDGRALERTALYHLWVVRAR
ncbi:MAG TPA: hypothetical protein VGJ84_18230 [Polyangiaceae bacterium]